MPMKSLGQMTLKVADIKIGERLRQIDEAHAELLAESLRQTGRLRNRPEVRQQRKGKTIIHTLISGGHRMRAVVMVGWDEVEVEVYEGSDDEVRLWEIDENLVRHDLNPLDRAVFLAERKALYLKLHPETKHGAQGGAGGQRNENDTMSFSKDTAEKCGWSAKTIERAVSIATGLQADVRARIGGTALAKKQSELLALIKLPPTEQHRVLDLLLSPSPTVKTVEAARRVVLGVREAEVSAADAGFQKLMAAWTRVQNAAARRSFLEHLRATGQLAIDVAPEQEAA